MDSKKFFTLTFHRLDSTIKCTCAEIVSDNVNIDDGLAVLYSLIEARNTVIQDVNQYAKEHLASDGKEASNDNQSATNLDVTDAVYQAIYQTNLSALKPSCDTSVDKR